MLRNNRMGYLQVQQQAPALNGIFNRCIVCKGNGDRNSLLFVYRSYKCIAVFFVNSQYLQGSFCQGTPGK